MRTLSYAHGTSHKTLLGQTIGENFLEIAQKYASNEALVSMHQNYRATYTEFFIETTKLAKALIAAGIKKSDRVGIWAPNRYEWVITQFATARIGAIMVNINPAYRSHELSYALNQSGVKLLIASKGFRKTDYSAILSEVNSELTQLQRFFIIENEWNLFLKEGEKISDKELIEHEMLCDFDDAINIQYTSGTTGYPKGATLSHNNILNNGYFIGERLNYTEKDRVCIPVPFYHCFGMVLANLAIVTHGATMVIPGEFFDPEQTLACVEKEKCTSLYGVPTMFIAELETPTFKNYNLKSLRTGIMAGAPCPEKIMREVIEKMHMKEVTVCYGMTETSPVSTQSTTTDNIEKRVTTVGRVHPHLEIKIIDSQTGEIVPRGIKGELCTRGYSVMNGYWNNEEETRKAIDASGWMHTGDEATMDAEGYVTITGRIKDIIIRGGENISPREIEEYLLKHPMISNAQIIGVPSYKYGEEVMAWIKFKEGLVPTTEELVNFCKGHIATYKIPKYWKFVTDFPMTISGKIRKIEMRKISSEELGLSEKG